MNKIIEDYKIISTGQLVRAIKEGKENDERFCFIIGSGASVSSGIPSGIELECIWMKEMEKNPGLKEIRVLAKKLKKGKRLENNFDDIEKDWKNTKKSGASLPSKYYFDIYTLRFFPNHRNGYYYFEKIMENKQPSFGYHPLALMLTNGGGNNLVITTNFDSLVEDALFMYTNSKPLVINHELLADFAGNPNIKRPIIAKIHRGIFFDPLNKPEETNELKGKWHDVLATIFQCYTPIVIGYGGGDNSLMDLLEEKNVKMKNGIYWCYMEECGLPNEKIQTLVKNKKGYLVSTAGFDAVMLAIGNALFPNAIETHKTEEYLNKRTSMHIENYEKEYKKLNEILNKTSIESSKTQANQSKDDFLKEIEKMTERGTNSENERKILNQITEWDYCRQGDRYYNNKDYSNAIDSYSTAIAIKPDVALFYNNRGSAYNELKKYEKAILDFNKAIELDPNIAVCYVKRGYAYDRLGEYDKAILDLNKAIELDPSIANCYNNRGSAYNNLGEYDKAILDLNKAIELEPNTANPYKHCGTAYKKKEDYKKAIQFLTKAIELNPKYKEAYQERAEVYKLLGESEKATEDETAAEKL